MPRPAPLDHFHPATREWFVSAFGSPTPTQRLGWPAIASGASTLILAPTGSGKTLTAFLSCLDRLLFEPGPPASDRCRVLYVSPLKALAVDVERNLQQPLAGIIRVAQQRGDAVTPLAIAVRSGDTPAAARTRFLRDPADILITTPESLFLLLTSRARERLAAIDTVIVDEIHAIVPGKRGAHLALSLERLEALRGGAHLQRIGLSATQRPLDEAARFLGGAAARAAGPAPPPPPGARRRRRLGSDAGSRTPSADIHSEFTEASAPAHYRHVSIVDASHEKRIELRIEAPLDEAGHDPDRTVRAAAAGGGRPSAWASIHPRLLDLIRTHKSTLLFVNSRRLAERLAAALNELAGEPLVRSHHGSLARENRAEVEDLLKAGRIKGLVATSSLELGIDMGAIDLVVQIEAPRSVASGLQRIGRAGHHAGATSAGVIVPKFRGDLVACAAVARAMHAGEVEATRYPRNPLDVLAQQIVAIAAMDDWDADALFAAVRGAAPFADLSRRAFEGVLDMLSGRYPSDDFAELRPRITWDRVRNRITAREGARRIAVANAGTIPDRGLYGVFLAGAGRPVRVGELDEEMVFETGVGETFTLGASTWRVEEITHDRVLVSPAPGEPGKMPFWHGDQAGRPVELGYAIGRLIREIRALPKAAACDRLMQRHDLDLAAAETLLRYLDDQAAAGALPDDRTIVIERCRDDLGDWRVCLLSPLGSRIHAPWAMAVTAHVRERTGLDVEVMWGDEGFVVRFPGIENPPDPDLLFPDASTVEALAIRQLGATSLFAARFREAAGRALLLPRRRPGARTPLWLQRKRAADLLAVASRFGSFPILLETYREVLRDHFDMPALVETLAKVSSRALHVAAVDSRTPSPFAASLLFSYVANYIYDGDTPLAERRAQALSVDQAQLRELLGDAELRELLDPHALESLERQLQQIDPDYHARGRDGLHDMLLRLGDLTLAEVRARSDVRHASEAVETLRAAGRLVQVRIAGEQRLIAVEDAARYRDAIGIALPGGIPSALLEPVRDPAGDLVLRYARTHGPFTTRELARRYGWQPADADARLAAFADAGRLVAGEFRPGGTEREWVDAAVLRTARRRSLAALRREIEPVDADAFGRFAVAWHGIGTSRGGLDALLDAIEQLQGAAVPASVLETDVLPARVSGYSPAMLDTVMAAGEVVWTGIEPLGERDGRVALYLTEAFSRVGPPAAARSSATGRAADVAGYLRAHGASFFTSIHDGTGGGFPQETVDALWELVWSGAVTNDTLHALRAYGRGEEPRPRTARPGALRSRRIVPPAAEGRWSIVEPSPSLSVTDRAAAAAQQLLVRHGIVARETALAENLPGGFGPVYQVLKAMEAAGRIRRGYFVSGLGGAQFAQPAALDLLRTLRVVPPEPHSAIVAATDPANPYGSVLGWPAEQPPGEGETARGAARVAGARAVLVDGALAAYLRRSERELLLFAPEAEPLRTRMTRAVARTLLRVASGREPRRRGMLIATINALPADAHPAARVFQDEGFAVTAMGLQARIPKTDAPGSRTDGIAIATVSAGGNVMADNERDTRAETPEQRGRETSETERQRIRGSNDRDQQLEREGTETPHNRGYDEAAKGQAKDVDPDSAESQVDRDDTVDGEG